MGFTAVEPDGGIAGVCGFRSSRSGRLSAAMMRIVLALVVALIAPVHAAEPELLEPDKAFRFSARVKDERSIEVSYRIEPGYYMYRDKFKFAVDPPEVRLGAPVLPRGVMKRDEFFG